MSPRPPTSTSLDVPAPPAVSSGSNAHAREDRTEYVEATAEVIPPGQEPAAFWVATDALHEWRDNPRKNDKVVPELVKSIKRFGFASPIIARPNGEIIAGHTRWKAAKKLGLERVPVRYMDLDPAEAHVLALADNKLGELAEWDQELLQGVVGTIGSDVDLIDGTGFSQTEMDLLLNPSAGADGDAGPELGSGLSYSVVIECTDERQQAMLLTKLERDGLKCRPVIS